MPGTELCFTLLTRLHTRMRGLVRGLRSRLYTTILRLKEGLEIGKKKPINLYQALTRRSGKGDKRVKRV